MTRCVGLVKSARDLFTQIQKRQLKRNIQCLWRCVRAAPRDSISQNPLLHGVRVFSASLFRRLPVLLHRQNRRRRRRREGWVLREKSRDVSARQSPSETGGKVDTTKLGQLVWKRAPWSSESSRKPPCAGKPKEKRVGDIWLWSKNNKNKQTNKPASFSVEEPGAWETPRRTRNTGLFLLQVCKLERGG